MRILIAEDDKIIADGIVRSLKQSGYAVDLASNGVDADNALATSTYDLLILDLGLPRLNGLEVLNPEQAAQILSVSVEDVLAAIAAGELKARRIGNATRIARSALEAFLRGE